MVKVFSSVLHPLPAAQFHREAPQGPEAQGHQGFLEFRFLLPVGVGHE